MPTIDYAANNLFLDDADFVFADRQLRNLLVARMRKAAGRSDKRARVFAQIAPIIDDFHIYHDRDTQIPGNEFISNLFRDVIHQDLKWPIAPFLAWLSFYAVDDAKVFYAESGLADRLGKSFRSYTGTPGDRAKVRKGLMTPPVFVEMSPLSPSLLPQPSGLGKYSVPDQILMMAHQIINSDNSEFVAKRVKTLIGRLKILKSSAFHACVRSGLLRVIGVAPKSGDALTSNFSEFERSLETWQDVRYIAVAVGWMMIEHPEEARSLFSEAGLARESAIVERINDLKSHLASRLKEPDKKLMIDKNNTCLVDYVVSPCAQMLLKEINYNTFGPSRHVTASFRDAETFDEETVEEALSELLIQGMIELEPNALGERTSIQFPQDFSLTTYGWMQSEQFHPYESPSLSTY